MPIGRVGSSPSIRTLDDSTAMTMSFPSEAMAGQDSAKTVASTGASSAFVLGKSPLERRATVVLGGCKVDDRVKQALLREASRQRPPGFRKKSKVVPPAFKHQYGEYFLGTTLHSMASEKVSDLLKKENMLIFQGMRLEKHEKNPAGDYEVECSVEVRPATQPPKLDGVKYRKPVFSNSEKEIDGAINNIRAGFTDWQKVDRPARDGDRVRYRHAGLRKGQEEPVLVLGDPRLSPEIVETFTDSKVGDELTVKQPPVEKGGDTIEIKVHVTAVEWGKLPELDIDLARKVDPEAGSVEAFRERISTMIEGRFGEMAEELATGRVLHILDEATPEFDLPERHVERLAEQRLNEMSNEAKRRKIDLPAAMMDKKAYEDFYKNNLRRTIIVSEFIKNHSIELADAEVDELISEQAARTTDPVAHLQAARKDNSIREQAREAILMAKARKVFEELVEVEEVKMDSEEIEYKLNNGDPEAEPPAATGDSK